MGMYQNLIRMWKLVGKRCHIFESHRRLKNFIIGALDPSLISNLLELNVSANLKIKSSEGPAVKSKNMVPAEFILAWLPSHTISKSLPVPKSKESLSFNFKSDDTTTFVPLSVIFVLVKSPKLMSPEPSLLTIVLAVFKLVAAIVSSTLCTTCACVLFPTFKVLVEVPVKVAVIVPAAKLPEPSLFTIVLAVFKLVAAIVSSTLCTTCACVLFPTFKVLVAVVAVVAFPVKSAVIVPAAKLPEPSLLTIVLAVF